MRATFRAALPVLFLSAWGVEVRGEAPPETAYLTNVEMVQQVARGAIAEAFAGFPGIEGEAIRVRPAATSEADWIVENEILALLAGRGVAVRLDETAAAESRAPLPEGGGRSKKKEEELVFPVDVSPVLLDGAAIAYPEEACREGLAGTVDVRLVVNEGGAVANVIVGESTGEPFESVVLDGVNGYRFTPATKDGETVPGLVEYRFDFPSVEEGCEEATVAAVAPVEEAPEVDEERGEEALSEEAKPAAENEGGLPVLVYRVSEMEMRYPRVGRRLWVGPKRVDRFARLRLDLRLRQGGLVRWSGSAEHYASDRVPFGALRYLESERYAFAQPEVASGGGLARFIEPLVVSGVIGGLVFLFYANQTGN